MPYKVRYLQLALEDLQEIRDFNKQFSQKYQKNLLTRVKAACSFLATTPEIYPIYEFNSEYRRIVIDDYQVFYKLDKKNKRADVYRILHGARNIKQMLR